MHNKNVKFSFKELLIITIVAAFIMSLTTGVIVYKNANNHTDNKYVNEFIKAYNDIVSNYYEDVSEKEVIDAAINGMLSYLGDDYTTYLNEENTDALNKKLAGTYEGIGITIDNNVDGNIVIVSVLDNSPAQNAGVISGDVIKSANGIDLLGTSSNELLKTIKNEKSVNLIVLRDGEEKSFNILKKELIIPAISSEILNTPKGNKVGYLYLSSFTSSLGIQVRNELTKYENEGISNLIIDLRENSGGYLKSATDIIEMFLKKNQVMFSLKYKNKTSDYKDSTEESKDFKIVIIIDNGSASASEVLTAALRDNNKAFVIGDTSYGKGKVQMTGELNSGSMYKYTSATWVTPKGMCIDKTGIEPDYKVEMDSEFKNNPIRENDNQLTEAINYFDN